ncbi:transposase [Micromonospora sp. MA102]|uniref:transposase n=1 Tax=Micromonospora sp. MA102 TaxID=2952755 RepID=UPI0021C627D4|nr:transposase [Micromonospora sp. MA102]
MRGLVAAAPEALRSQLTKLSAAILVNRCTALTVDPTRPNDPEQATAAALAGLARRVTTLTDEITTLDRQLAPLVRQAAPRTSALFGVGTDVAAQLLTTAGDNPDRLRSEAALAHLRGAAPIPASSGGSAATASTEEATAVPTTPCTPSPSAACATTHAQTPTCNDASKRDSASRRSSAASSATSSATSTQHRRPHPLTSIGASGWHPSAWAFPTRVAHGGDSCRIVAT